MCPHYLETPWVKYKKIDIKGSSITEGIGQSRETNNLTGVIIDDAVKIKDREALKIIYELIILNINNKNIGF